MQAIGSEVMKTIIGNLCVTSYCSENPKHIRFKHDLMLDEPIYEYVSTNIGRDLQETSNDDKIKIENSYIVQDREQLIGYIFTTELSNVDNIVELRYAVHPEFRRFGFIGYADATRKGYGQLILEECRDYLFSNTDINAIELHIRKDNEASIGCAEKAKYKRYGENNHEYYYIYRSYKGEK